MFFQKIINRVSVLISWLYGFTILRIYDFLYIPKISFPGDPFFQHPSNKGIVRGILSVVVYFSVMFILNYIVKLKVKEDSKKFIYKNAIAFFVGLFLFFIIGPLFLPYNDVSGP
ncbi:hypothetical protein [Clostridium uliginosum]|uniref:Uncharacterized protein n=1 Tax=Clostridium uliginosum TaxID=119641 RepID=A0A1I1R838_9CLOT|nr:hypothetical protein [Clostridium uliginosum]SFD28318.1 hypothetical protein SAMN05421842_12938 [Clostridium uliginosum]